MANLKDHFDEAWLADMASRASQLDPSFPAKRLLALPGFGESELKERVAAVADALFSGFARPFPQLVPLLVELSGAEAERTGETTLDAWPLLTVVERHGLPHAEDALDAMYLLTRRFSAEFAIRPFLIHHPGPTWARLGAWVDDPSSHVRRLVSEGTRPRLPWGRQVPALIQDPEPGLALIARLRADPNDNVRNSVANHLNDVSKDHPERVVAITSAWAAEAGPERARLVTAALRTLVKRGHPSALALVGGGSMIEVQATLSGPPSVAWGATLEVRATLRSTEPGQVVADWILEVPGVRGPRRKVFKGAVLRLEADVPQDLRYRVAMVPRSTRPLSPGPVSVALQVDGRSIATYSTELLAP